MAQPPAVDPRFGRRMRALRQERRLSLRALEIKARSNRSSLSEYETGRTMPDAATVRLIDDALGAGGALVDLARRTNADELAELRTPPRTRVAQALAFTAGQPERLSLAADSLGDLIEHYALTVRTLPPARAYDELLSIWSLADTLTARADRGAPRRADVGVAAGWLSNLLAIAATYLGDHPAALVWCVDAERAGRESGHPELAAWATLSRATMAYYQGHADRSAVLAVRGQQFAPAHAAVRVKLAAQEMRAWAMHGDTDRMSSAKKRAVTAMAQLPSDAPAAGAFSVPRAEDPPYTATSLLLAGEHHEAAEVTSRILDTVYRSSRHEVDHQSSNYARTLLILGLAEAGLGRVDAAAQAGGRALDGARPAWPTMVLADQLDRVLTRDFPTAAEVVVYHERYRAAARTMSATSTRQALPTSENHE